ncbi:Gldg family protein [Gallaecimonas sp. GXIMD4217]|uniref:DUF7088 domain-containing protein n=1 Tax=Gallaecimonas sp. GXIMD4217 TaxID=3131927 RepID=UPI00311AD826
MQPKQSPWPWLMRVAAKEAQQFFASPVAYLFLACFAAVTLFAFFWGEAFFARNIADVRPLFEWMPVLLIFLASALTMRLWSEERRTGTLEHVLTQPVPLWCFVLGKFLGCLLLLAVALVITLPLPLTVAMLGDLDWGPVWAGYLATLLLGACYLAVGLFVSARSDNQIVSLITASALCGGLYLLGSPLLTELVGIEAGQWLRALGTGSRFEAIARGVIDLGDLYYYLSLTALFLVLNTLVLEKARWSQQGCGRHRLWHGVTALLLANLLGANLWLGQLPGLRLDLTEGRLYSLSEATRGYLKQLREPLLIRGYFSSQTHPLLAPLVPRLQDLLREYQVAGGGQVRLELVDPARSPELEEEANRRYGIEPVPFQVADRYQASIVSSYFNVLVQYGDEHQLLGFRDLIEVKARGEGELDVQLRNPEYDLTQAIRKVLRSYQGGGNLFDTVKGELAFTAYVSPEARLPEPLVAFSDAIRAVLDDYQARSGGRLKVDFVDPEAGDGALARRLAEDYGFQPLTQDLLSREGFYYYLTLARDEQVVQLPLGDLSREGFERNLEAAIKRFASGFTKTVALVAPGGYGGGFNELEALLGTELNVVREDIDDGVVGGEADILVLVAPEQLDDKALFAVDQFLMKGGTVIAATSPFSAELGGRSLAMGRHDAGLADWLAHHGLTMEEQLVLDPQSGAFPIPVTRDLGGFQLREIRMLDYPYFVDVRGAGLNEQHPITAQLPQAWLSPSLDVLPGAAGFAPEGEQASRTLALVMQGRFQSYFAGKASPLLAKAAEDEAAEDDQEPGRFGAVIQKSPASARLILFASNDFLRDQVLQLAGAVDGNRYLNSLQLLANSVDWALDDGGLMQIRSRGHFNRTLVPMEHDQQLFWEYLNYGLAALLLAALALLQRWRRQRRNAAYQALLAN